LRPRGEVAVLAYTNDLCFKEETPDRLQEILDWALGACSLGRAAVPGF